VDGGRESGGGMVVQVTARREPVRCHGLRGHRGGCARCYVGPPIERGREARPSGPDPDELDAYLDDRYARSPRWRRVPGPGSRPLPHLVMGP